MKKSKSRGWLAILLAVGLAVLSPMQSARAAGDIQSPSNLTSGSYDVAFVSKYLTPGRYMPVSDIKPGMVGYGLTVFRGTKVERFNVSIIGVVKKMLNGRDAILARLSGGEMGPNCVIKGMSGSPVYIDGKLIGAVSFGYDFSKEPIAGITPIVDMLDALMPCAPERGPLAKAHQPSWIEMNSKKADTAGGGPRLIPLMSPVSLVGFSPRAEQFLEHKFKDLGLSVASGAAGGQASLSPGQASMIQPGSAVSVLLTTGDFNTVSTGTVTARFGSKVLAFGHPFLQAGAVDFPMSTAVIHQVLPSLSASFKVASPLGVVGALTADRPWAIGGQIGRTSKLVPAVYTVTDETRKMKRTFRCNIIDHPDLTAELLAATTMSAIDATHQSSGPYVAKVVSHVEAEGVPIIDRIDRFSSNFATHSVGDSGIKFSVDPVGTFLLNTVSNITNNDFQKASLKNIKIDITLQDGHETAQLERVYLDKSHVAPGDTVNVNCVLKPYGLPQVIETVPVQVPRDVPDGNLLIGVCGGESLQTTKKRMGLVDPQPENLKQIAERIMRKGRGDALNIMLALPEQSLIIGGVKLINPPAHWSKIFFSNRHTKGPSLVKGEIKTTRDTKWLLEGSHILTVDVRNPDKAAARSTPYAVQEKSNDDGVITTELARKTIENSRKSSKDKDSSDGKDEKSAAAVSNTSKEYPHMRAPLIWRQETEEEFRAGKMTGTTVDSWGRMTPGFEEIAQKPMPTEMQIWSSVFARDNFWFGTKEQIWRWKGDSSAPESMAKIEGAVAIPAMVADSRGNIYAASVPDNQVWMLTENEKPKVIHHSKDSLITALAVDEQDNLYVGTAGAGKVYKLDQAHQASVALNTGQAHITSLFASPKDKRLYVGTAEKGAVYAVSPDGQSEAIYQSPDHIVTGAIKDKAGDLYVSSAGSGHLVRVLPSGEAQTLATSEAFYTLYYDKATDSVYSGDAEGDVTRAKVDPISQQAYFFPVSHTEQEAILALTSDPNGRLFAGTSNLARLLAFKMRPAEKASYDSSVRDAGRPSRWSQLQPYGAFNEQSEQVVSQLSVQTRTGDTSQPDESWSAWQQAEPSDTAFKIVSPPRRYLQYKLSWKGVADKEPATVGRIDVSYLPRDAAPKFGTISTKPGTAFSGKHDLTFTGTDPDGDNLLLSIAFSQDNATSWQPLATAIRARRSIPKTENKSDTSDSSSEKEDSDKDKDKDKDKDEAKDKDKDKENTDDKKKDADNPDTKLATKRAAKKSSSKNHKSDKKGTKPTQPRTFRLPPAVSSNLGSPTAKSSGGAEEFTWNWDTTKVKDGSYILKFTLNDKLSNPLEHSEAVALRAIVIDNTAPEIEFMDSKSEEDGTLKLKVGVADKLSPIANATFRIDEGEPFALASLDGAIDRRKAVLGAAGLKLKQGSHKVEVKLTDAAGNTATKSFTIKKESSVVTESPASNQTSSNADR